MKFDIKTQIESIKCLAVWFSYGTTYQEEFALGDDPNEIVQGDSVRGPITCSEFLESCKDHFSDDHDGSVEFCPLCGLEEMDPEYPE